MVPADLVAHILYDALERGGSLVSPIGWSLGDLQVEETRQRQMGREWPRCLWWRLAEHRGLRQEETGDDYPVVPVGAHGGRRESSGRQSGPSKSYDGVITGASRGKFRDLLFAERPNLPQTLILAIHQPSDARWDIAGNDKKTVTNLKIFLSDTKLGRMLGSDVPATEYIGTNTDEKKVSMSPPSKFKISPVDDLSRESDVNSKRARQGVKQGSDNCDIWAGTTEKSEVNR